MEISEYGLLYMNFLVVAWVLKKGGHVKVDIIFNWLNPRNQLRMDIFTSIIAGIASLLITVYGAKVTWHLFKTGYYTPTILELPKFIIIAIIPTGFLLLFIQFIRKTYDHIKNYRSLGIKKEG
jgi:TRAP-type C4-dicarboxylate transport system permease small subunit